MEWMLMPYRRYADFSGRSRRKEYWMFVLFQFLVIAALAILAVMAGVLSTDSEPGPLAYLLMAIFAIIVLGSIVPSISVVVRRFHDQDKSGWMYLIAFIPYIGGLVVFIFMCLEGTRGPNRFGPDPKDPHYSGVFE
jgi:uncharacterized membrane protein YhaH (DUF805 family)